MNRTIHEQIERAKEQEREVWFLAKNREYWKQRALKAEQLLRDGILDPQSALAYLKSLESENNGNPG